MNGLIRQGDILLVPVGRNAVPIGLGRNVPRQDDSVIVAEGEATGHHHRIRTKGVVMYRDGSSRFLKVPKGGAEFTHEEHETLFIPQGFYRIENQREYVPQAAPQRVYD